MDFSFRFSMLSARPLKRLGDLDLIRDFVTGVTNA